ncbi:hypothetical protein A2U01_0027362 [Trifolium medium]|uniref:Uncharacterized protein n=1 Tax=Trifolium medium TaxID=97028 RepID=A0A392P3I6_9FABA|nr:hypothetical protein [Trifolium medium]
MIPANVANASAICAFVLRVELIFIEASSDEFDLTRLDSTRLDSTRLDSTRLDSNHF